MPGALPPTRSCPCRALLAIQSLHALCAHLYRCGTVVVDLPGAYLTAALRLTDCVHLQLPAGVTLLAGDKVRCA